MPGEEATSRRSTKKQATLALVGVIAEESETVLDEKANVPTAVQTPMTTALLQRRMLDQRAAYSRLTSRRDRLSFLRQRTAVPGTEAQMHGDRLFVERVPQLRRLRFVAEPRPPPVMGVRARDRRADDVSVLTDVVPSGTVLLQPPDDDDDDLSRSRSRSGSNVEDGASLPSRTLDNWSGVSGLTDSPT